MSFYLNCSVSRPVTLKAHPRTNPCRPADRISRLERKWFGAAGKKGDVPFTTTHWSVVLEAQSESPVAQEALEKLCRAYWRPIYGFVQRQGIATRRSKGYHPGFFCRFAGAQEPCCRPQGKRTLSFVSSWSTKIFSGRRAASRDGNQARKRTKAYPTRRIRRRRTNGEMEPPTR